MQKQPLPRTTKIARFCTLLIFLPLIRCIAEVFRLQHYNPTGITYGIIKPFMLGALATAITAFAMVILLFYKKHMAVIATCISTIILLFVLKFMYGTQ
ncbi:MAG TPA: hypothetical protein VG738_00755 [Chitinophagaceae bacterium]|nr:hypothetical protein [Chitinophagaceae bacterium]